MKRAAPSRLDLVGTDKRRDYVRRELGERRHHLFRAIDGRIIGCGGPGLCVECNREARR